MCRIFKYVPGGNVYPNLNHEYFNTKSEFMNTWQQKMYNVCLHIDPYRLLQESELTVFFTSTPIH